MWCGHCHQDIPGVAQAASGRLVCSQCQRPMASRRQPPLTPICDDGIELTEQVATRKTAAPPTHSDDWAVRRRARDLDRALRRPMHFAGAPATITPPGSRRFDPPQNLVDPFMPATTAGVFSTTTSTSSATRRRRDASSQVLAWLVVAVGTAALLAGVGLIGWSLAAEQIEHWNLALSLAIGGQGAMILGLALVVARLWRNSRYATNKLLEMHACLGQLQNSADAITATRAGGAPAFYADLARGASPPMLRSYQ